MITSPNIDPVVGKALCSVLQFSDKKMDRILELGRLYRFSTDEQERHEIFSVLAEMVNQGVASATFNSSLDDTVDRDAARSVAAYKRHVGNRIRELRISKGLTQEQLAEKSGLPQSHISRLEKGRHAATSETIRRISASLDVEMGEIDPAF